MEPVQAGRLYIVATPIGNYHDMSERGIETLRNVDLIAAEDTRRTIILLNKFGIRNELISNHNYNEHGRIRYFLEQLTAGKSIAVVTDAGTPCISDPGNALIRACIENGIDIVGIPGCCAAINALTVTGFDLSSFLFLGFFPRENGERVKILGQLRRERLARTVVFYESPKRIMGAVEFLIEAGVQCQVCLCNDMTKSHEMHFRGTPEEVREKLLAKVTYEKGEYVMVLELDKDYIIRQSEHISTPEAVLVDILVKENCSMKEAIRTALDTEENTYSKKELYAAGLHLKELFLSE
ncbi:MAG: 16S rRNA (cytidine(1402)-2'-O)-methyltransferase [Oscillospiraceae bacterium]|nr:16S rRNA (cytidine(1402)-2'-O)-methyltransferase [Oscillospiraceae bacterium]MBR1457887.1 16S rRNA (cytidine(1402)-2'-O)-methyltransferase [Oscillospiraceae bacterium]MBR1898535.1 16S rRNA (cytidine(1402)-2'-O)-methyltransferase [Oscillospiraceae bacterium]